MSTYELIKPVVWPVNIEFVWKLVHGRLTIEDMIHILVQIEMYEQAKRNTGGM